MGEHTWRYTQRALRQRYLALFVPALARINADYPHGSGHGLQLRARAVRRAADTCLVAAAAASTTADDDRFKPSRGRLIIRRGRRSYKRRLLLLIKRRVLVLFKRKSRTKRLGSNHKYGRSNYSKADLRSAYNKSPRSARLRNLSYHNNDAATAIAIPAESELKRLQGVIFPHHGNGEAGAIKPATLLTQTAHYILALQAQVDALQYALAQAADPAAAAPNTAACTLS